MSSIIVDTNLLVYAWDVSDRRKQARSIDIFENNRKSIALTTQNLSELSAVLLRKKVNVREVGEIVSAYARLVPVLPIEPSDIAEALRAVAQYRMSFWDAQIWAVAKRCGKTIIFSEDGPTGQAIEGVVYVNPLT